MRLTEIHQLQPLQKEEKRTRPKKTQRNDRTKTQQGTFTHSTSGTLLSISLCLFPVNSEEELLLHVIRRSSFKSHSFSFAHLTSVTPINKETDAKLSPQETSRSHHTVNQIHLHKITFLLLYDNDLFCYFLEIVSSTITITGIGNP